MSFLNSEESELEVVEARVGVKGAVELLSAKDNCCNGLVLLKDSVIEIVSPAGPEHHVISSCGSPRFVKLIGLMSYLELQPVFVASPVLGIRLAPPYVSTATNSK